jgi:Big-like domain-containing protein
MVNQIKRVIQGAAVLVLAAACYGQSCTVATPAAAETIAGPTYSLTATLTSVPSAYSVEWIVDQRRLAIVKTPPYSYTLNSWDIWNGDHKVKAVVRDALGTTLATCAEVAFKIGNYKAGLPSHTISASPSTAVTSDWAAVVTVTVTLINDSNASVNHQYRLWVDGILESDSGLVTAGSYAHRLDTTKYENGAHYIHTTVVQDSAGAASASPYADGVWDHEITTANGTTPYEIRANNSLWLVAGGATAQLSPVLWRTDETSAALGTTVAATDDFVRPNETPLAGNWTNEHNSLNLNNNRFRSTVGVTSVARWNARSFNADQHSQVRLASTAGTTCGPAVRVATGAATGYTFGQNSSNAHNITRFNAGTGTLLATTSGGVARTIGDVYTLEVSGSAVVRLVARRNGVVVLTYSDDSASRITSGSAGIFANDVAECDTWEGNDSVKYNSSNPTAATVSATGLVTPLAEGDSYVRISQGAISRMVQVSVNSANTFPHFGTDASMLTAHDPTKSHYFRMLFGTSHGAINTAAKCTSYTSAFDTFNGGLYLAVGAAESEASWESRMNTHVSDVQSALSGCPGTYWYALLDEANRGDTDLFIATRGIGSTYTPPSIQYAFEKGRDAGVIGVNMADEPGFGVTAVPEFEMGNAGGPAQITVSGGTCTATWASPYPSNAGNTFIITGATSPNLNSVEPAVYTLTPVSSTVFTFPCTATGGPFNDTTDPNLRMEMWAFAWHSGDYVRSNAFTQIKTWHDAVSGAVPPMTYGLNGGANAATQTSWRSTAVSNFMEIYPLVETRSTSRGATAADLLSDGIDPLKHVPGGTEAGLRSHFETKYGANPQRQTPLNILTNGAGIQYNFLGLSVTVASVSNDIITFTGAHGITRFTPGTSRVSISGNTNSAYNKKFYIISVPTATTIQVAYAPGQGIATGNSAFLSGTITWQDTTTSPVVQIQSGGNMGATQFTVQVNVCKPQMILGMTYTVSGSSTTDFNRSWWAAPLISASPTCAASLPESYFGGGLGALELPQGSGTGGTAKIVEDNIFRNGLGTIVSYGSRTSGAQLTQVYAAIAGAAASRVYNGMGDPRTDLTQNAAFSGEPTCGAEACGTGVSATVPDIFGSQDRWRAILLPNNLIGRTTPLLLQPRLAAPDYGTPFETTLRSGANGRLLIVANYTETRHTRTIDLTGCDQGQTMTRYRLTESELLISTIATGTASQAVTLEPVESVWYACPAAGSTVVAKQPVMRWPSTLPVAGATKIALEWAYDPTLLGTGQATMIDCAGGTGCTVPADIGLQKIYYRYQYLNSSNVRLAVSDIQSLARVN